MQQKQPFSQRPSSGRPRPGQDILVSKQAARFPTVGMTLQSYDRNSQGGNRARYAVPSKPKRRGRLSRIFHRITLKRVVLSIFCIFLAIGLFLGGKFLWNAHKLFGGNLLGVLSSTKLDGEDKGRVNILLAGNSADDVGHNGGELTDSIMILSIDTRHNKAFMLSVPRDLYVSLPDQGYHKINYAYVAGENDGFRENGYPKGGMGELEQVVEENFGLDINYYALVNYKAFKQAVDAVGGIDVTIKSSDPRGLYDPNIDYSTRKPLVKLSNGTHHLNGQQALNLARARGDSSYSYGFAGSDFDRTQHQREMLVALKSKAVSAGVLANPAKLSSLFDAIGNNVKTDLELPEVRRLYEVTKPIGNGGIQSYSLNNVDGKNLLTNYTNNAGESTLVPAAGIDDYSDIQAFLKRLMSSNAVVQEGATVVVLNATDKFGLASKERTALAAKNFTIGAVGNADTTQPKTTIIDVSGGKKPGTLAALKKYYNATSTTTNPYTNVYDTDFIVMLGNDRLASSTQPSTTSN